MSPCEWTCCTCGMRATNLTGWVDPVEVFQPCRAGYECRRTDWLVLPQLPLLPTEVERHLDHDLQLYGVLAELNVAPMSSDQFPLETSADLARLLESIDMWATADDLLVFKYRHWPAAREFALTYPL